MRHLTFTYAKHKHHCHRVSKLIPVLLYLRKWRDLIAQPQAHTLPEIITQHHIPNLPEGTQLALPPNWAVNRLNQGNVLIMFDGFDEVAEGQRQAVSQ